MCTGSASWFWRQVLHLPQLRRLFAPGSHLTGEQLLALVLALFIRHRLTAGHPDLTATGALDFTAGGASGTNPPESRDTPARRPGFCRYEEVVLRLVLYVRSGLEVLWSRVRVRRSERRNACIDRLL